MSHAPSLSPQMHRLLMAAVAASAAKFNDPSSAALPVPMSRMVAGFESPAGSPFHSAVQPKEEA